MIKLIKSAINKLKYFLKINKEKKIKFEIINRSDAKKNIIFFLPATKSVSGGAIVTHDHASSINVMHFTNVNSQVMYPSNIKHYPQNFVYQSSLKSDYKIDISKDFVILPEVMVLRYIDLLYRNNIKYGIHVQNGYLMDLELRTNNKEFSQLKNAYERASIIIGNSKDTIESIIHIFPFCKNKLLRSYFVINKHRYQSIENKKNIITYMPRKLAKHSQHLLFFLKDKVPQNWKIIPIDGVPEQTVYDILYESKIFLSFSEFEGLAMPPAMAAMSGNKVIGYTGEANKEYFHLPSFEEIPCGDIKLFAKKVLEYIELFESKNIKLDMYSINYLEELFSRNKQEVFIRELVSTIDKANH